MINYEQKFAEVFADKEFAEKVLALTEPEDVQKAFADKGIDLSIEDVKAIGRMLAENQDGELSEEALLDVAGGSITGITVAAVIGCVAAVGKLYLSIRKACDAKW